MTTPALSVTGTGPARIPYLTVPMMKARPTALAFTTLVRGGTQAQQDQELANLIQRASRWADSYTGRQIGAQVTVQQDRLRVGLDGYLSLYLDGAPLRRLTDVKIGYTTSSLASIPSLADAEIGATDFIVMVPITGVAAVASLGLVGLGRPTGNYLVRWTYEAGWACTYLTATANSGQANLVVNDPTGVLPGDALTIYDADKTETITVQSLSGATVTATAPLVNTHTFVGGVANQIGVTNLPDDVQDAVGLAVAALVKERSATSVVMQKSGQSGQPVKDPSGLGQDWALARALLDPFMQMPR